MKLKKIEIKPISENPVQGALLIIGIVTGFIFIVAFSSLYVDEAIKNNNACGCVIPIPYMILILSSLGVFVGTILYYFMASRYTRQKRVVDENLRSVLNFLEPDERQVVKALIDQKEDIRQSNLEKFTGFDKVKIHRLIKKLSQKQVVSVRKAGKASYVTLNDDIKKVFFD